MGQLKEMYIIAGLNVPGGDRVPRIIKPFPTAYRTIKEVICIGCHHKVRTWGRPRLI